MARYDARRCMTPSPVVTSSRHTLADAHERMREHGIRHLPVVDGGRLFGVVSQRDLYMLETLRGIDAAAETVGEAMTLEPYALPPDAPLEEVARTMADRKYGCAVVIEGG